jgi:GDP/UDP-N,N'-diacetylbacillosamine 2-epimerase (hydrolysing)
MKVAVLTSSRADYGIYLPLLKAIQERQHIELDLIVFGTHCSSAHGFTVQQIKADGFEPYIEIENLLPGDSPEQISKSFARTVDLFANFWQQNNHYDWVLALGDRFEMAAAVQAGIPFGIRFAHLHAGETTLGAIDNIYRHQISLASQLHFVSTPASALRVQQIVGSSDTATVVGALSLDNLKTLPLLSLSAFLEKWKIDLQKPSVLMTVHPETIAYQDNEQHLNELSVAIETILKTHQVIVTLPNADTSSLLWRKYFLALAEQYPGRVFAIENFGSQSYFTCMNHVDLLIGNTSSGILEAASFGKYVLNLGSRQAGRECGPNVISVPFVAQQILEQFSALKGSTYNGENIYFKADTAALIINKLEQNLL